jgi:hypothetical protein
LVGVDLAQHARVVLNAVHLASRDASGVQSDSELSSDDVEDDAFSLGVFSGTAWMQLVLSHRPDTDKL